MWSLLITVKPCPTNNLNYLTLIGQIFAAYLPILSEWAAECLFIFRIQVDRQQVIRIVVPCWVHGQQSSVYPESVPVVLLYF